MFWPIPSSTLIINLTLPLTPFNVSISFNLPSFTGIVRFRLGERVAFFISIWMEGGVFMKLSRYTGSLFKVMITLVYSGYRKDWISLISIRLLSPLAPYGCSPYAIDWRSMMVWSGNKMRTIIHKKVLVIYLLLSVFQLFHIVFCKILFW